jgi:3-hydroxybutyryl-CoA dehydratase
MKVDERFSFEIGEEATLSHNVTKNDIQTFSKITGDANPIHIDDDYAKNTIFGGRIAHGFFVAGLVSAVLGTRLPGPGAIYVSQQLRFLAPVYPGDTIIARVKVLAWDGLKGRMTLLTEVTNQNNFIVLTGEAQLVISSFLKK